MCPQAVKRELHFLPGHAGICNVKPRICLKWINVPPQCSSYNPFPNTKAAASLFFTARIVYRLPVRNHWCGHLQKKKWKISISFTTLVLLHFQLQFAFYSYWRREKKIVVLKNKLQDFATRKQARKLAIFLLLKQSWTNPRKPGPQNTYRLQMEPLSASSVSNRWKPVIGWRFESYRNLSSPGYWAY